MRRSIHGGWATHPEDVDGDESAPSRGLYSGSAGTVWALTRLASQHDVALAHDYAAALAATEDAYRADPFETGTVVPSYFLGTVGIMLARFAITADATIFDRLAPSSRSRRALGELGAGRIGWRTSFGAGSLRSAAPFFRGRPRRVGNLAPFVRALDLLSHERRTELFERARHMLDTYVIRDGAAANWCTFGHPPSMNRMQWCHGAPGVIIGLAKYPTRDRHAEAMLVAGGEGIWRAGPLRKGPTLCHGTAGNGFALLRLAHRTGDERWRSRAERFAAHAMQQVDAWRRTFGMPSFSLWTGDVGVALFVSAVLRNDPNVLTLDCL